jgi:serine/threonine protein kinase
MSEEEEDDEVFDCLSDTESREHLQLESLVAGHGIKLDGVLLSTNLNAVFEATDMKSGRRLAVKALLSRNANTASTQHELATLALLGPHPNLVRLWPCTHYAEAPVRFIALELMPGGDLLELLQLNMPLREPVIWHLLRCLLRALCFLHSRSVVHNDVKLENLLCSSNRLTVATEVRLCDLGLSTLFVGNYAGSHGWIAPEKCSRELPRPSFPTDVFSAGLCGFSLASGKMSPLMELGAERAQLEKCVGDLRYSLLRRYVGDRSLEFRRFIQRATRFDAAARPTAERLLRKAEQIFP